MNQVNDNENSTNVHNLSNKLWPYVEALLGASGITEDQARICVLYTLVTHREDLGFNPILAIIGNTGTGKSDLLSEIEYLVREPKIASATSYATMRDEMDNCPTYIIDEADKVDEELLIARSQKTKAKLTHKVGTGQGWEDRESDVFGATILARRTPFRDAATRNRAIVIHTRDKPGHYQSKPISGLERIAKMIQPHPLQLSRRDLDVWQPLLEMAMGLEDSKWTTAVTNAMQTESLIFRVGQDYEPENAVIKALDNLTWSKEAKQRSDKPVELAIVTSKANEIGDVKLIKKQVEEILIAKGFKVSYTHGDKMVRPDTQLLESLL